MLKEHTTFVFLLRSISDICIIGFAWISVFYVRFSTGLFASPKGVPDFRRHLILAAPVIVICYLSCLFTGLYKPKRAQNTFLQIADILKAGILGILLVLAFLYYSKDTPYSRKLLPLFACGLFAGLILSHLLIIGLMRRLREKGYNLRHYAVIGAGAKGEELVRDIEQMGWLGLRCVFFVDNDPARIGTEVMGIPVYGPVEKLAELATTETIDEVYLALSGDEAQKAYPVLKDVQSAGITIRIVPDWGELASVSGTTAITIGSQVLFSAGDSPLSGVNIVLKEIFDRAVALLLLVIFALPMVLAAVLIKLTSEGPVFYEQIRIGMDQKEFKMLKFRTMKSNAEEDSGPQWASQDDPRRTFIGKWLRRLSVDELPQFINVLKGEMSLVGPRPERPVFAKQFSEIYKRYMLRHKVKAGMTGWAQVNGLRGDTSIRKRLVYDLYYVRNWSWGMDIWILLRTPWHIFKGENAY